MSAEPMFDTYQALVLEGLYCGTYAEWVAEALVVTQPENDPEPPDPSDAYWGACPVCHESGRCLNVGKNHWLMCEQHLVCWSVGYNLFSSWREETEAIWAANERLLALCSEVVPWSPPEHDVLGHDAWRARWWLRHTAGICPGSPDDCPICMEVVHHGRDGLPNG
jgi:hypothetical protein